MSQATLSWLRHALRGVTEGGTGYGPFSRAGVPADKLPVATKTGTGEVYGKQTTSWFASYAPANKPQYAVVMMVTQGGTGSGVSGPSVAELYKTLFGVSRAEGRPRQGAAPRAGTRTTGCRGSARRDRASRRRAGGRPPTGCPTCPAPSCRRTGATSGGD